MSESQNKPVILITNDDGVEAKGLLSLIETVRHLGVLVVVAPAEPQSGMSHAITVKVPLRLTKVKEETDLTVYKCYGTPVDCVKMALNHLMPEKPGLLLSGINHGSNSAASVFYSGTMGAALEGCINEIPSIGFSLLNLDHDADFTSAQHYARLITERVMKNGLPPDICLNVNVPDVDMNKVAGIKICRQNRGYWQEEFDQRTDPAGKHYYWLTGVFRNSEPDATDTDEWALNNNFVSIVPLKTDLTSHDTMKELVNWNFNHE
jgi:5'-nucleotidase